jgi:hypothetical protein
VLDRVARAGFSPVERVWGIEGEAEDDDRLTILARARTSTP